MFYCYLPRIIAIPNHLNYCETVIDVNNLQKCPWDAWYEQAGRELETHGLQYACADGAECLRLRPTNKGDKCVGLLNNTVLDK